MLISIVSVGRAGNLAPLIREYEQRAARYWRFESVEVRQGRGRSAAEILCREGDAILARLRPGFVKVATTRVGDGLSSTEMARWLGRLSRGPERGVHFLIGGAFGLDPTLRKACGLALSLSALTLPHDLARLVLAEQLYRAGTILRNEPYHKGP